MADNLSRETFEGSNEKNSNKFLTFALEKEDYGIPIQLVREIIGMLHITNVPKTPKFIKGVVNLRGKIIPVIDLRLKFELTEIAYNDRTCIIVVEIKTDNASRQVGIVVDTVSEVLNIMPNDIEIAPKEAALHEGENFITGMGKVKDKVIMILNIEKILSKDDMKFLKDMKGGV